jgi:hypothetical protein
MFVDIEKKESFHSMVACVVLMLNNNAMQHLRKTFISPHHVLIHLVKWTNASSSHSFRNKMNLYNQSLELVLWEILHCNIDLNPYFINES